MSVERLTGTPWHKERVHREEGDDRRYKGRCKYYQYNNRDNGRTAHHLLLGSKNSKSGQNLRRGLMPTKRMSKYRVAQIKQGGSKINDYPDLTHKINDYRPQSKRLVRENAKKSLRENNRRGFILHIDAVNLL